MADFSKQWCEINDPEMPWDFDILEVAESITPQYGKSYICEGFGFIAIAKDDEDNILLAFSEGAEKINWKTYNEVINGSI